MRVETSGADHEFPTLTRGLSITGTLAQVSRSRETHPSDANGPWPRSTAAVKDGVKGGEISTTVRWVVRAIRVASRGAPKHGLKPYGHRIAPSWCESS